MRHNWPRDGWTKMGKCQDKGKDSIHNWEEEEGKLFKELNRNPNLKMGLMLGDRSIGKSQAGYNV